MSEQTMTIDLQSFCGEDSGKHAMSKPFVVDRFTYATDRAIVVRVPGDHTKPCSGPLDKPYPPTSTFELWDRIERSDGWVDYPKDALAIEGDVICICQCDACGGWGAVECPKCGHEDQCDQCNGKGSSLTCPRCKGTGEYHGIVARSIFGVTIADHYHNLIAALPGVQVNRSLCEEPLKADSMWPVYFRFDGGGQGIVMPKDIGDRSWGRKRSKGGG